MYYRILFVYQFLFCLCTHFFNCRENTLISKYDLFFFPCKFFLISFLNILLLIDEICFVLVIKLETFLQDSVFCF